MTKQTATMPLAERPAYHLRRLMVGRGLDLEGHQAALGREVWPDVGAEKARGRIRNVLRGHWPKPATVEDLARWFGVYPSEFYAPARKAARRRAQP